MIEVSVEVSCRRLYLNGNWLINDLGNFDVYSVTYCTPIAIFRGIDCFNGASYALI